MKGPILFWILLFGVCGVVGYVADIGWLMVVGGIGVVFYIFVWRSRVTTLHLAIEKWETPEVIELMREEKANIKAKDNRGNTPLHIAARCNKNVIALMLIYEGSDVDAKNNAGNTPLHWAAKFNAKEVAQVLIAAGADVHLQNKDGLTPRERALVNGHSDLAQLLLEGMLQDITEEDLTEEDFKEENHEYS